MTVTVLDRALVAGDAGRVSGERPERPDPEVPERARRRSFTAQYKLDVVAEYDAAATGEKGAVLRREGLYSSHVIEWRRARDAGALAGPARPRGRPAADPRDAQIARLRKEKAKLEQELAKARFVVDVQSKLQALLACDLSAPRALKVRLWCRRPCWMRCCAGDEGLALRRRPAGGDVKPPQAALAEDRRGERWGKGAGKCVRWGPGRRA